VAAIAVAGIVGFVEPAYADTASPLVTTQISQQTGPPGTTVHDQVVIDGLTPGQTVPSISWTLFGPFPFRSDGTCLWSPPLPVFQQGTVTGLPPAPASSRGQRGPSPVVANTQPTAPLTRTGCYTYTITVGGTTTPISQPPETIVVTPTNTPTISTTVSATTAPVGATLTDSVRLGALGSERPLLHWELRGPAAPAADGTCTGLSWESVPVVDHESMLTTGAGTYTTRPSAALTSPGCYSYLESLPITQTTAGVTSPAGLAAETTLVTTPYTPTVTSAVSTPEAAKNSTVSDSVTIANLHGASTTVTWQLIGPSSDVSYGRTSTTSGAIRSETCSPTFTSWPSSLVVAQGSFTVTGDGTYTTPTTLLTIYGCYTYVESVTATPTTAAVTTLPGALNESVFIC
jgi:hypothetical protein